jgi:hypothetical protein
VSHTDAGIQTSTDSGVAPDSATSPRPLTNIARCNLILVRFVTRLPRNTVEAVVLVLVGFALIVAALLSYSGHPVRDSNLHSRSVPGWITVVLFVLIGSAGRLSHLHDQRRARKRDVDTPNQAMRPTDLRRHVFDPILPDIQLSDFLRGGDCAPESRLTFCYVFRQTALWNRK